MKPSNILFAADGAAKVADFGLAKRLDADPETATRSDVLLGTPAYMAPEQVLGRPAEVGPAADVHALGAVLFECLTGRPPFLAANPVQTLDLIRAAEPPSPCRLRPGLPADLETICLTCLEKDPARRFGTAAALADDLGRFARGESILARPSGRFDRAVKWARRRPFEAAFATLLAVSLVGTISGLLIHQARLRAALHRVAEAADDAREQREEAESNYRDARDAIGRVLAAITDPKFSGSPRLAELHRAQAEAALAFYDHVLARSDSADPVVRRDTARAAVEAANLQITLGRPAPAEVNLLRAHRLYDGLVAERPADAALLHDQMVAHIKLGVLLMGEDNGRSIAALERALAIARELVGAPGLAARSDEDVAWCEHNLGSAWQYAGELGRALPHYQRAVASYQKVRAQAPGEAAVLVELGQTYVNLGLAQAGLKAADEAEAAYREAESLLNTALSTHPGVTEYVASKCDLLVNWGNLDVAAGRLDAGIARHDEGLRNLAPFREAEPNVARLKRTAINLHGARALALGAAGRHREAADDWGRVAAIEGSGAAALGYRATRLLCLARAGEQAAVAAEGPAIEAASGLAAIDRYNLACAYSIASVSSPDRSALRARALGALATALAGDSQLRELAPDDPDLAPLADEAAFRDAVRGR